MSEPAPADARPAAEPKQDELLNVVELRRRAIQLVDRAAAWRDDDKAGWAAMGRHDGLIEIQADMEELLRDWLAQHAE